MHIGYTTTFANPDNILPDQKVYREELRLCDLAVELGFDSLWSVEHHFDDYTMCPEVVQFLTYEAGRHDDVLLGSGVIVLPWHDPLRVAEQVSMLDNLSGGRMILGLGRGLARIEYEGFRVDMNSSRKRFVEYARIVLEALEKGYMEYDNEFGTQPRVQIRPRPLYPFAGRTFAAAVSPESMPIMAELGIRVLIVPQKPWPSVIDDLAKYGSVYREVNAAEPPPPFTGGLLVIDESADRAEELARKYMGLNYASILRHYEFEQSAHKGVKGYEFYAGIGKHIAKRSVQGATDDYVNLMPWGTPTQVLEKYETIFKNVNTNGLMPTFAMGGMPFDLCENGMRLFAEKCIPEIKSWDTLPFEMPGRLK